MPTCVRVLSHSDTSSATCCGTCSATCGQCESTITGGVLLQRCRPTAYAHNIHTHLPGGSMDARRPQVRRSTEACFITIGGESRIFNRGQITDLEANPREVQKRAPGGSIGTNNPLPEIHGSGFTSFTIFIIFQLMLPVQFCTYFHICQNRKINKNVGNETKTNNAIIDNRLRPQCRILTNSTKHCSCLTSN